SSGPLPILQQASAAACSDSAAKEISMSADQICAYSKAMRGNVDVTITLVYHRLSQQFVELHLSPRAKRGPLRPQERSLAALGMPVGKPKGSGGNCGTACHTTAKAKDYIFHPCQKR